MAFLRNDADTIWHRKKKKLNLNLSLIPYIKFNSKYMVDLNVKYKTIKHLEKKQEKSFRSSVKKAFFNATYKIKNW